jgi:RING finger/CHY zinc finger protein 1
MHGTCLTSFTQSGQHTCPLCKRSILNEEQQRNIIQMMDVEIGLTPMPIEYAAKRVRVLCHDCGAQSVTPFHIIGLKCAAVCGSYNTAKIGEAPDASLVSPGALS